jgi:hypothetical protein
LLNSFCSSLHCDFVLPKEDNRQEKEENKKRKKKKGERSNFPVSGLAAAVL